MTEKEIETEILTYLNSLPGCYAWKHHQVTSKITRRRTKFEPAGVADVIGIFRGKLIAVEVKTPKGKVSTDQENFINAVNRRGGIGFVARSVEEVKKYLELEEKWEPTLH